jgi:hypothetical protein
MGSLALFGPSKQILPKLQIFYRFAYLYNKSPGTMPLLGVWSNLVPTKYQKLLTEPIGPHYPELENFEIET